MVLKVDRVHICLRGFSRPCGISFQDKFVFLLESPQTAIYTDKKLRVDGSEQFVTLETTLGSTLVLTLPIIPQVVSVTTKEDVHII